MSFKNNKESDGQDKKTDIANKLMSGEWVKVATRKEGAPEKLKAIWIKQLKAAVELKSKRVKKRDTPKDQKEAKASIPEERDVWTFWKWVSVQLGMRRSTWSKALTDLGTKEPCGVKGNLSTPQAQQEISLLSKTVFSTD